MMKLCLDINNCHLTEQRSGTILVQPFLKSQTRTIPLGSWLHNTTVSRM